MVRDRGIADAVISCATCAAAALFFGCAPSPEAEFTAGFAGSLPANGKIVVFANGPLAPAFVRTDGGRRELLSFEKVGSGSARGDIAFVVDPGDVTPGETIHVEAECAECHDAGGDTTFALDDDTTAPTLAGGRFSLEVFGIRDNPWNPLVASYEIVIKAPTVSNDDGGAGIYFRATGNDVDVLMQGGAEGSFFVDGGIERTLCFDLVVLDDAQNGTEPVAFCVELDASTAPAVGQPPTPATESGPASL